MKDIHISKQAIKIIFTSLIASLACTGIIYAATTIGTNISTTGTLSVTGVSTLTGNTAVTGTLDVTGLTTIGNASTTLLSISNTGYIGGSNGLILSDGSITDASGSIDFGNEQLTTTGNIGIGTSSPYAKLSVVGEIVASYFTATSTTASSTFTNGVSISGNLEVTGSCAFCSGGLFINDADAQGDGDFIQDDDSGNELIHSDASASSIGLVSDTITINSDGIRLPPPALVQEINEFNFTDADISGSTISKTSHGLDNDDWVIATTTGTLPDPLVANNTVYYVVEKTDDTFKLSATEGGTALALTGQDGSATHAITEIIRADACGGIKRINSTKAIRTSTHDTFEDPVDGSTDGCIMHVINTGTFNITLDGNSRFAGPSGGDYVLSSEETVIVGEIGDGVWYTWGGSGAE